VVRLQIPQLHDNCRAPPRDLWLVNKRNDIISGSTAAAAAKTTTMVYAN